MGNWPAAQSACEQALELQEKIGDERGKSLSLLHTRTMNLLRVADFWARDRISRNGSPVSPPAQSDAIKYPPVASTCPWPAKYSRAISLSPLNSSEIACFSAARLTRLLGPVPVRIRTPKFTLPSLCLSSTPFTECASLTHP